jgi:hypothetical protein
VNARGTKTFGCAGAMAGEEAATLSSLRRELRREMVASMALTSSPASPTAKSVRWVEMQMASTVRWNLPGKKQKRKGWTKSATATEIIFAAITINPRRRNHSHPHTNPVIILIIITNHHNKKDTATASSSSSSRHTLSASRNKDGNSRKKKGRHRCTRERDDGGNPKTNNTLATTTATRTARQDEAGQRCRERHGEGAAMQDNKVLWRAEGCFLSAVVVVQLGALFVACLLVCQCLVWVTGCVDAPYSALLLRAYQERTTNCTIFGIKVVTACRRRNNALGAPRRRVTGATVLVLVVVFLAKLVAPLFHGIDSHPAEIPCRTVCVCVCVRACVRACVHVCVLAHVCASACACVRMRLFPPPPAPRHDI